MNKYSYTREKLYLAIKSLAIGQGDVRSTLSNAYLIIHILIEDDFPPEFQRNWRWIIDSLTKFGPLMDHEGKVWRGSVENTIKRIRNSTGKKIATKVFNLSWQLHTNKKYF